MQPVGPILAQDAKPLPQELASFLEQGSQTDDGAIYVAMGTFARQTRDELKRMASVLSKLPNPVLWKLHPEHMPGELSASTLSDWSISHNHGQPVFILMLILASMHIFPTSNLPIAYRSTENIKETRIYIYLSVCDKSKAYSMMNLKRLTTTMNQMPTCK